MPSIFILRFIFSYNLSSFNIYKVLLIHVALLKWGKAVIVSLYDGETYLVPLVQTWYLKLQKQCS